MARLHPFDECPEQETLKITYLKCMRCGGRWIPRSEKLPDVCPKCNSPYWNKKRKVRK